MRLSKAQWIGTAGNAWERVGLAFQAFGYNSPTPDTPGGEGAYTSNIPQQYMADLSEREVLAIIWYGLTTSKAQLQTAIQYPPPSFTRVDTLGEALDDLMTLYTEEEVL